MVWLSEFPALENRRAYLEHALYSATQMANDAAAEGKPDAGTQQWLAGIEAELRELRYALAVLGRQGNGRIELSGRTILLVGLLMIMVLLAQIAILLWMA